MTPERSGDSCEWTVTGMDCAACATKIRTAVERHPGVSDVVVAVMAEKLTLKLEPGTSSRGQVEAAVEKLGFGIGARKPSKVKSLVMPDAKPVDHAGHDHDKTHATPATADGQGEAGHVHETPAERGLAWYQKANGRLVIGTGALLAAAWSVKLLASAEIANGAFIAACLIGVAPVAKRADAALRSGSPFTIEMALMM